MKMLGRGKVVCHVYVGLWTTGVDREGQSVCFVTFRGVQSVKVFVDDLKYFIRSLLNVRDIEHVVTN